MTRSELITLLTERFPQLSQKDVDVSIKEIIERICQSLVSGNRVEIRGFGSFSLNYRPPRVGRNPKTGDKVAVAGKYVPHFKAGKEMRDRIDQSVAQQPLKEAA
jgi:integration host factor subunit beta